MPKWLDALNELSANTVRGYDPNEKIKKIWGREIPGMPDPGHGVEPSPEAERYASNYLAAKSGRPQWAAALFNALALKDLFLSQGDAVKNKFAGIEGFKRGRE